MSVICGSCGAKCEGSIKWATCLLCGEEGTVQHHCRVRNDRRESIVLAMLKEELFFAGDKGLIISADRLMAALDERHQQEDGA